MFRVTDTHYAATWLLDERAAKAREQIEAEMTQGKELDGTLEAVSYTHLDVYKRQVVISHGISEGKRSFIHRQEREYPVICGRFLKNGLRLDDMAIGKS